MGLQGAGGGPSGPWAAEAAARGRLRRAAGRAVVALPFGRQALDGRLREAVLAGLGRPSCDPFAGVAPDPAQRAANLARPAAGRAYALIFTPRSGSSRLAEILTGAGTLGHPGEVFSPGNVPAIARRLHAADMAEYVEMLRRFRGSGDVWGFKATWDDVRRCFGSAARFARATRPAAWVWLLREDIVLQAVSISRMVQTRVPHNHPRYDQARLSEAEARFRYDGADIANRIVALRRFERGSERMFARLGVAPLRLSYERALALEPADLAGLIARHVGAEPPRAEALRIRHAKLGTDKNLDFAARFRAENRGLVGRLERARAPMVAALDAGDGASDGASDGSSDGGGG